MDWKPVALDVVVVTLTLGTVMAAAGDRVQLESLLKPPRESLGAGETTFNLGPGTRRLGDTAGFILSCTGEEVLLCGVPSGWITIGIGGRCFNLTQGILAGLISSGL